MVRLTLVPKTPEAVRVEIEQMHPHERAGAGRSHPYLSGSERIGARVDQERLLIHRSGIAVAMKSPLLLIRTAAEGLQARRRCYSF
jgi:hypothetical protein